MLPVFVCIGFVLSRVNSRELAYLPGDHSG
jgi:hypothetical protein